MHSQHGRQTHDTTGSGVGEYGYGILIDSLNDRSMVNSWYTSGYVGRMLNRGKPRSMSLRLNELQERKFEQPREKMSFRSRQTMSLRRTELWECALLK